MASDRDSAPPHSHRKSVLVPGLSGPAATGKPLTGRGLGPKLPAALAPACHWGARAVDGCVAVPAVGVADGSSRALLRTWSCLVAPRNEFSRMITIEPWPEAGVAVDWSADLAERRALAQRFDLIDVTSLRGYGRLTCSDGDEFRFEGRLEAEVVQTCVVSLEPVPASIDVPVVRRYRRAEDLDAAEDDAVVELDEDEEIEPLHGREIDLGEALAEQLGLALDPYPRAANADDLAARDLGPEAGPGPSAPSESPFAALRQLHVKRADR